MNLIVCDQKCKHQKDGYCTLNQISQLSNEVSAKCGYFETGDVKQPNPKPLTEYSKGL